MRPYEYTPRLLCVHIHTLAITQALGGCTAGPFKGSVAEEVVPIRCAARLHATLVWRHGSHKRSGRAPFRPRHVTATRQAWLDEQLHQGDMEQVGQTLAAASVQLPVPLPVQLPTGGGAPLEPTPRTAVEAEEGRCSPTADGAPPDSASEVTCRVGGPRTPKIR